MSFHWGGESLANLTETAKMEARCPLGSVDGYGTTAEGDWNPWPNGSVEDPVGTHCPELPEPSQSVCAPPKPRGKQQELEQFPLGKPRF